MNKFRENVLANRSNDERGDIVQTLLIIVIFVVIVVAVGGIIWRAIDSQAKRVEACIDGANPVNDESQENC